MGRAVHFGLQKIYFKMVIVSIGLMNSNYT
jgi:hypothetical protein